MADQVTILGIAAACARTSYNKGALRAAQKLCPEGAKARDLRHRRPAALQPGRGAQPDAEGDRLQAADPRRDAILIATPEYNYGNPRRAEERDRTAPRAPTATAPGTARRWP